MNTFTRGALPEFLSCFPTTVEAFKIAEAAREKQSYLVESTMSSAFAPPSGASAAAKLPRWIRLTFAAARKMNNLPLLLEAGVIPQLLAVVQSPKYIYAAGGQEIPESRKPSSSVLASWQSDLVFAISALAMLSCDMLCAKAIFDLGGLPVLVLTLNVVQARTKVSSP